MARGVCPGARLDRPGAPLAGADSSRGDPGFEHEAGFVRAHTEPGDEILSLHPEVYWLSERRAASRFFDLDEVAVSDANARERRADLLSDPPAALVLEPAGSGLGDFVRLTDHRDYELGLQTGSFIVLLRADRARQAVRGSPGASP